MRLDSMNTEVNDHWSDRVCIGAQFRPLSNVGDKLHRRQNQAACFYELFFNVVTAVQQYRRISTDQEDICGFVDVYQEVRVLFKNT